MSTKQKPSKKKNAELAARAAQVAKLEEAGVIETQGTPAAPTVAEDAQDGAQVPEMAQAPEIAQEAPTEAPTTAEPPKANAWAEFFGTHEHKPSFDPASVTLKDLAEGFSIHLMVAGKSPGTRMSYLLDLGLAMSVLGEDTRVQDLTEEQVTACFESEPVTKTRSGRGKAQVGIDKTRRVFRQAMDFAVSKGVIATSPVAKVYCGRRGKGDA